jgi:hypothetical protein
MALDPISLLLATAVGAAAPATAPETALRYDRIGQAVVAEAATDQLALARHCGESIWKMSGIQLVTCMIAHPEDVFSPSEG